MTKSNEQVSPSLPSPSYDESHLSSLTTTSSKIRYLDSCGIKRGPISKILGIRYQWVRNVLITPLKKG